MKIRLDLDGVIVNFIQGTLDMFNTALTHDDITVWNIEKRLGLSTEHLWHAIDSTSDFWESLPVPWAEKLIALVEHHGSEWACGTSPALHPNSASGKVAWMQKHRGRHFRNYILTLVKQLLAHPQTLLIDDSERNINAFRHHGGRACLFPQAWNRRRDAKGQPLAVIHQAFNRPKAH